MIRALVLAVCLVPLHAHATSYVYTITSEPGPYEQGAQLRIRTWVDRELHGADGWVFGLLTDGSITVNPDTSSATVSIHYEIGSTRTEFAADMPAEFVPLFTQAGAVESFSDAAFIRTPDEFGIHAPYTPGDELRLEMPWGTEALQTADGTRVPMDPLPTAAPRTLVEPFGWSFSQDTLFGFFWLSSPEFGQAELWIEAPARFDGAVAAHMPEPASALLLLPFLIGYLPSLASRAATRV